MPTLEEKFSNIDLQVARNFGDQWNFFHQKGVSDGELRKIFDIYFSLFPWEKLDSKASCGVDVGCGSGRWAKFVAPRVGKLHCLEASSKALEVARKNLREHQNAQFDLGSVGDLPYEDESLDFAYCVGVLHHIPDPVGGMKQVARKLKPGAPFLFYIYYAFDNRGWAYKALWKVSDFGRKFISRLPFRAKFIVSQLIAATVYFPLAKIGKLLSKLKVLHPSWTLSFYIDKPFYVMRTDALDRFGTRLEKRFTQVEIKEMLTESGFENIEFSKHAPYWVGVAYTKSKNVNES